MYKNLSNKVIEWQYVFIVCEIHIYCVPGNMQSINKIKAIMCLELFFIVIIT